MSFDFENLPGKPYKENDILQNYVIVYWKL